MINAILKNGTFVPRDPLPDDWQDGTEVQVEKAVECMNSDTGSEVTDTWIDEVTAIASQGNPSNDARLEAALQEIRTREKSFSRRNLELDQ